MILDTDQRRLRDGDKWIPVSGLQMRVLTILARHPGTMKMERLIALVYENADEPDQPENVLMSTISQLHRKMDGVRMGRIIGSLRGRGSKGYFLLHDITFAQGDPGVFIPGDLLPELRSLLYRASGPAVDRMLALVEA